MTALGATTLSPLENLQGLCRITKQNCGLVGAFVLGKQAELFAPKHVKAPRSWTGRAYPKLIHYNKVAKGGVAPRGNSHRFHG